MGALLGLLALGSGGSSLASWLLAGRGTGNLAALLAMASGRLLLDAALWLVAAGLLGAAERVALPSPTLTGPQPAPRTNPPADPLVSWHQPLAVAGAHRVWLAPAAAAARLAGLARAGPPLRLATWLGVGWLIYRLTRERGHGRAAALSLLAAGLLLPAVLLLGGLALSGLGWLLAPLWPGGVPPFLPL